MKKSCLIVFILLSFTGVTQTEIELDSEERAWEVIPSIDKDTVYIVDSDFGRLFLDSWNEYKLRNKLYPKIIMIPNNKAIIEEHIKRLGKVEKN